MVLARYVLKAAAAARTGDHQRVIYVSSVGANPGSLFLYPQCVLQTFGLFICESNY